MDGALSLLGILLALFVVIYGSLRSVSMILLASIAAAIVTVTGGLNLHHGYATLYMTGVGNFVRNMLPLFITGAIFGKLVETSGLASSVAAALMKRIKGGKGLVLAIFITVVILVTAGVSVFVIMFVMYPMAVLMFKKANITKDILPALILGGATAQNVLPGTPGGVNVLAAQMTGTTVGAAPITGFLAFAMAAILTIIYMFRLLDKLEAKGMGFIPSQRDAIYFDEDAPKEDLPPAWMIIPPLVVVLICLNVFNLPAYQSLVVSSALMVIMFFKKYNAKNFRLMFNEAAQDSQFVIITATIAGFGAIISAVPGFALISDMLDRISGGNPYIFALIAINLMAGFSGSAMGGINAALTAWGDKLIAAGAHPESLMRLATIAGTGMDSLPHNSAVLLTVKYCEVDPMKANKYLFVVTVLFAVSTGIIPVVTGMLGIF